MTFFSYLLSFTFFVQQTPTKIVDGYTNRVSAFAGDSIELFLNATKYSPLFNLRLYDVSGKEVKKYTIPVFPQSPSNKNPFENGYGYTLTKNIVVPDLPSGLYLMENKIPLVIKARNPKITVVYSSNTVNAYSNSGGKSLYVFNSSGRTAAQKVSFLRPLPLPAHSEAFLRWIQKQNFSGVGYVADCDLDEYQSIQESTLLIITGHSEYWTLNARKNFDRFVNEGKNAMILSGNTMWWQVRYNNTRDQLICYRDAKADPVRSARLKTINWYESVLAYPITSSTGTDFRNGGYGLKKDKGWDGYKIIRNSPLLEGTKLKTGDILFCPSAEMDGIPLITIENGIPIPDYEHLGFFRSEVIGYDLVSRGELMGAGTWIVFQTSVSSGIVINTASTDWCSAKGIGSNPDIAIITQNMIKKLLNNENVFSPEIKVVNLVN